MSNFKTLLLGDLQRMRRYNIFTASIVISLLWIGMLHFTTIQDIGTVLPLLLFVDATSMAILLIGVTIFFEKQEGTLKTLLVAPISKGEYILAKTFANVISNIKSLLILYIYARIFKEINVNILGLIGAVILVSFLHSMIGFLLTYYSKDFTGLLMGMMKYAFVLMIPAVLEQVGIIKSELISNLIYILPTKASMLLLQASVGGVETWEIYFSTLYIVVLSGLLLTLVLRKFNDFAVKESGV